MARKMDTGGRRDIFLHLLPQQYSHIPLAYLIGTRNICGFLQHIQSIHKGEDFLGKTCGRLLSLGYLDKLDVGLLLILCNSSAGSFCKHPPDTDLDIYSWDCQNNCIEQQTRQFRSHTTDTPFYCDRICRIDILHYGKSDILLRTLQLLSHLG